MAGQAASARSTYLRPGWQMLLAIVLLGAVLRALVFDPWGIIHVDEMMQYLERANRLVSGYGIVTWEQRLGMRSWIIPQMLAGPMWVAGRLAPGTIAPVIAARLASAAIGLTMIVSAYAIGQRRSRTHALAAAFALAVWYQCLYFSDSLLSESFAAGAIFGGIGLAIGRDAGKWKLAGAGLLLGIGLLFRFPYVIFAGIAAIGLNRLDIRRWGWMALGGVLALLLGAASDLAAGMQPYGWLWENFHENIAAGQAQRFGIAGPLYYPVRLFEQFGPMIVAIAVLGLICPPRYRILLAAIAADLAAHSLLAHKEFRFIYLSTTTLVLLAAMGGVDIAEWIARRTPHNGAMMRALPFVLIAVLSVSAWIYGQTRRPIIIANPAAPLAASTLPRGAICGLILSDRFRYSVPLAFLGRDLPLYSEHRWVEARAMPDPGHIPSAALQAANTIIAPRTSPIPPGYREIRCLPQQSGAPACLFLRAGPCDAKAGAHYLLQNVLIASKL